MKKLLTAILVLSLVNTASANDKIFVDTKIEGMGFSARIDEDFNGDDWESVGDLKASLKTYYKTSTGNKLGFFIELDSNFSHNFLERNPDTIEEAYLFSQSNLGMIEIGRIKNIAEKMQLSAPDVGVLGINKSFAYKLISMPNGFIINDSIANNFAEEHIGINYITPKFYGWQIGFNYSTGEEDFNKETFYKSTGDDFKYGVGGNIKKKWKISNRSDISLAASHSVYEETNILGYSMADSRQETTVGGNWTTGNWTIGAGYKNIDEEEISTTASNKSYEGYAYNAGIAYNIGRYGISYAIHKSNAEGSITNADQDKSTLNMISIAKKKIWKDLDLAISMGHIEYEDENSTLDNSGQFIGIGGKYKFRYQNSF